MKKKEFLKIFEIKNLGEHDGLYVQSDALLIADAFEIFRNMPFEIYKFDPEKKKISAPGISWQDLKKNKVKLDLLIDIDMLLMVEKGIRGGISHSFD